MRPPVGQRRADGRQTRPRSVFEKEARGPAIPAAGGFPGKRKNPDVCQHLSFQVEAPSRLELENEAFAELCLTTWLWRRIWSGRRDSDSRHPPWQGGTLPLSYYRIKIGAGEETRTHTPWATDPKSAASAIPPHPQAQQNGDPLGIRTPGTLIKSQVLYQLS